MSESTNSPREPRDPNFVSNSSGGYPSPSDNGRQDWAQESYWSHSDDSWSGSGDSRTIEPPSWEAPGQPNPSRGDKIPDSPQDPSQAGRKGVRAGTVVLIAVLAAAVGGVSGSLADRALVKNDTPAVTSNSASPNSVTKVVQGESSAPDWTVTASAVSDSVVAITVSTGNGGGEGSGVVVDANGNIVTNNHVVADAVNGGQLTVSMGNKTYEAKVVGTDPSTDLAVIRVANPPKSLKPISFADSNKLTVGSPVMAVGNPLGLSGSVTTGIISALNRPVATTNRSNSQDLLGARDSSSGVVVTNAIQTSAAINPGNSGGALVNANGELIGINSSIASLSSGESEQSGNIGIGFAIPSNLAKSIADQIIDTGKATHAFLGISVRDVTTSKDGAQVLGAGIATVSQNSAADKGGLQRGDVVTKIDDTDIVSGESLVGLVRSFKPGQKVKISYIRGSKEAIADVTLGTAKS
ncbi:S1C family serine protease [Cutibacterium sp.]|uniref:S1C family serine protease n=1 Tax=Cutibacterium sp. TaxID=1912221 RepID=UPI0026DADBA5|nr:trypsin-like peptidase domain-containing protein [Cutibacterium sp.]MDO4412525.1 trypsin-like peptidase domain-containing protein [Cutibacterium sp.]